MRGYQLAGMHWLATLYEQGPSPSPSPSIIPSSVHPLISLRSQV